MVVSIVIIVVRVVLYKDDDCDVGGGCDGDDNVDDDDTHINDIHIRKRAALLMLLYNVSLHPTGMTSISNKPGFVALLKRVLMDEENEILCGVVVSVLTNCLNVEQCVGIGVWEEVYEVVEVNCDGEVLEEWYRLYDYAFR